MSLDFSPDMGEKAEFSYYYYTPRGIGLSFVIRPTLQYSTQYLCKWEARKIVQPLIVDQESGKLKSLITLQRRRSQIYVRYRVRTQCFCLWVFSCFVLLFLLRF
jgi:hypothetical protein